MPAVEIVDISRNYVSRTGVFKRERHERQAVKRVSLRIEKGELYGLLGPNGAGKTSIIKMLSTLLIPTSGTARVLGFDVVGEATEVRRRIGYVFGGDRGLYDRLSAQDNLRYFAELYGVPPREQRHRIGEVLELVDLADRRRERVQGFSRGMRQRLHIARGILHDPPVLLLDEPSIGIDPVGARELRKTVAALAASGKAVLLTTHYMYEADELCDRVGIIRAGSIVAEDTPSGLKARVKDGGVLEAVVHGVPGPIEGLRSVPGVASVALEDREHAQVLVIRRTDAAGSMAQILRCLEGFTISSIVSREPTLEDAYVEMVGRA